MSTDSVQDAVREAKRQMTLKSQDALLQMGVSDSTGAEYWRGKAVGLAEARTILAALQRTPTAEDAESWTERYWCGCVRVARWKRCDEHAGLEPDEEPPTQAATRSTAEDGGWRPIETAPRDGTLLLVCVAGTTMRYPVRWHHGIGWSPDGKSGLGWETSPTHWMPLPAPPSAPDAGSREEAVDATE